MRDAITTALEVAGIVALAVAGVLALWPVAPAAGVGVAGVWLIGASALIARAGRRGGGR